MCLRRSRGRCGRGHFLPHDRRARAPLRLQHLPQRLVGLQTEGRARPRSGLLLRLRRVLLLLCMLLLRLRCCSQPSDCDIQLLRTRPRCTRSWCWRWTARTSAPMTAPLTAPRCVHNPVVRSLPFAAFLCLSLPFATFPPCRLSIASFFLPFVRIHGADSIVFSAGRPLTTRCAVIALSVRGLQPRRHRRPLHLRLPALSRWGRPCRHGQARGWAAQVLLTRGAPARH